LIKLNTSYCCAIPHSTHPPNTTPAEDRTHKDVIAVI